MVDRNERTTTVGSKGGSPAMKGALSSAQLSFIDSERVSAPRLSQELEIKTDRKSLDRVYKYYKVTIIETPLV
jgi:hypothetical protein